MFWKVPSGLQANILMHVKRNKNSLSLLNIAICLLHCRACPSGAAWADKATADNTAHAALTECSAFGYCNRATGVCECRDGYSGEACQRKLCPGNGNCSGHGRCISVAQAGIQQDFRSLVRARTDYTGWDAHMIHGCACDAGYGQYDCSARLCPQGADPQLTSATDDKLSITCTACGSACSGGTAVLTVNGQTTLPLPWDAPAALIRARLLQLPAVVDAAISFSVGATGLCGSGLNVVTDVVLTLHSGELAAHPVAAAAASATLAVPLGINAVSVTGTRVLQVCSGRGLCSAATGTCSCFAGYASSNGRGDAGSIPDCGYISDPVSAAACPNTPALYSTAAASQCNTAALLGNGTSSCGANYRCNCPTGFGGTSCERLLCSTVTPAWFDEPVQIGPTTVTAHAPSTAECGGRGKLCLPFYVGIIRSQSSFDTVLCSRY
jgi:EGF-like domain